MNKLKYLWITYDGIGLSVAYKLLKEGNEVLVGQIQDIKELGEKDDKPEKPTVRDRRLSVYSGILNKLTMPELIKQARAIKNKDEWFVVFDFNNLWRYAKIFQGMGFKNGFFPTKEDYEFEKDRDTAKDIVKKYYTNLTVAEVHEFKKVQDGVQFLNEAQDQMFVLKGNADEASTVCPESKHAVLANQEIITQLEKEAQQYEKSGFILEEKIQDPMEFTPEAFWYNGELLAIALDIENKPIGAGNKGKQTGCSQNLLVQISPESKLAQMAFPPYIYDQAKKRNGLFVYDASILAKGDKYYFGEFCSNRWGWDSFFTELAMCDSVSSYFESLVAGENPFKWKFGAAVRGFNLDTGDDRWPTEGWRMNWLEDGDTNTWIYDLKLKNGEAVNCGTAMDLAVFTGGGDTIESSVNRAYQAEEGFSFANMLSRPKEDFLSEDYPTSIINRYQWGKDNNLF